MSNSWIIYTLSNPLNATDVRYVGATSVGMEKRKLYHIKNAKYNKKSNYYTADWIRNLLKNNLEPKIEILEQCSENNWQDNEIYWINQMRAWGFNLTNTANGGLGMKYMSKEIRQKISISNKGKKAWNKGIFCKEETKKKISEIKKGIIPWNKNKICKRGKENSQYGTKKSNETIKNIKNGIKNMSVESRENIKQAVSKATSKSIIQYTKNMNFVAEWNSAMEVYKILGINRNHIGECCNNNRKSAGGFIWKHK